MTVPRQFAPSVTPAVRSVMPRPMAGKPVSHGTPLVDASGRPINRHARRLIEAAERKHKK